MLVPAVSDVEAIVRSLQVRLGESFDRTAIEAAVQSELVTYSEMPVTQYLSILVERRVLARLAEPQSMNHATCEKSWVVPRGPSV